ncbi:MAG: radical SAM protein [Solidesulfovibrio sp. DCME]|uniref:radical SAM protein n=1 Tax=Solidesulfovibrio sp. DCME TaxID=3447380 RepID=UPI003D126E45
MEASQHATQREHPRESPDYLRLSLAAAMTLGFSPGLFYRDARLYCVNLLLTYPSGCAARCAYCGLSGKRPGEAAATSFIRVAWPSHALGDIIAAIAKRQDRVKRICISMLTNRRCVEDTETVCRRLRQSFDIPVSLLVSPTVIDGNDLAAYKKAGADKVGVAIDLATPELFDRYRGAGVGGPHQWDAYWQRLGQAIDTFGRGFAGAHFMVGMGETEAEMCAAMARVREMGGNTHLFSFFPEPASAMAGHPQPPMAQYRRVQLARYLIDAGRARAERFVYDDAGRIVSYGLPEDIVAAVAASGEPFRTSGCTGYDGQVACNRPYANSRPGPDIRNYPFKPDRNDIRRIRRQMEADPAGQARDTATLAPEQAAAAAGAS